MSDKIVRLGFISTSLLPLSDSDVSNIKAVASE